jgi:hypothetical protein
MRKLSLASTFLLSFVSLCFLYVGHSHLFSPWELIRPLIILWTIFFLLSFPAYWITKDWNWAGLLLILILLGFFSHSIFAYAYSLTVLTFLFTIWTVYRFLLKRKFTFHLVYFVINIVSLVSIVLMSMVTVTQFQKVPFIYYKKALDVIQSKEYVKLNGKKNPRPDIYYFVLDGYGRSDILKSYYKFDNSEFIDNLKQKGFVVPSNSRSNYPKTVISVTSTLNMNYIDHLTPEIKNSTFWWLMSPWLDNNLARTSLERIGYTSVSTSTDWSITDNPTTDYYLKSHPIILTDFERYFFGATPAKLFQPLLENVSSMPTFNAHRRSQLNNFDAMQEIVKIPGPKFVFAHIILPHPPFVFSRDGSPLNPPSAFSLNDAKEFPESSEQYREQYVDQVQFLNGRLEPMIDSILENSKEPPIIILQADHGPGMQTDFGSAANTCLAERFSTFSAYYLPGMDTAEIPQNVAPVNLFRIIFDHYFDAGLPLLENAQYYPTTALSVYSLENVTTQIDNGKNCNIK